MNPYDKNNYRIDFYQVELLVSQPIKTNLISGRVKF